MKPNLLILGHTLPEPATTAAGHRMMQLIMALRENFQLSFGSTADSTPFSEDLEAMGIEVRKLQLNDSSFDSFIRDLDPTVVLFDRFLTEEQFGWRVQENCPKALRILDTEDLHFLRKARMAAVKKFLPAEEADLFTEDAKREIASILRSDLSLIISEAEYELLVSKFGVPEGMLMYLPFMIDPIDEKKAASLPPFEARADFITLGNFQHAPNLDAVIHLKNKIWPGIRSALPQAGLHIYGAYVPKEVSKLHNKREGFFVRGWAENADEELSRSRICLAPLRAGAGLKGKILDAMKAGTPVIATPIGAEGISGDLNFPGYVEADVDNFVSRAVSLYHASKLWQSFQQQGFLILEKRFGRKSWTDRFLKKLDQFSFSLDHHRKEHFIIDIMHHQTLHTHRYMSKWIEVKNINNVS